MNHEAKAVLSDTSETLGLCKNKDNSAFKQKKETPQYFGQKGSYIGIIEGIMTSATIHQIRFTEYSAR
jgi:hypothetical protein